MAHASRALLATTALSGCLALFGAVAAGQTLPSGGAVVGGAATITQTSATRLDINQTTDRAVINWNSFSIGAGYQVGIQQPGAGSVSVQQVIGTSASQIFGQLTSNGRVVIANPNGIWFGAASRVEVAGLVASTATMSAPRVSEFMTGGALNFDTAGLATASIVNEGTITIADGGIAALVAPGVANSGVIAARLGRIQLASGNRFTLDLNGDGLVNLVVDDKVLQNALGPDGQPLSAAVLNSGTIQADGGTVLLSANVAAGVVDNVIDMTGIVQARAVSVAGGEIVLSGGNDGKVAVSGTLDASGAAAGQTGGTVKVLGEFVVLNGGTSLNVSGDVGGGTALIGGNFNGAGPEQNASRVYVDGAATINANAVTSGNGGNVAVWSNLVTGFNGTITARGGSVAGDGGLVETSGGTLGVTATAVVDTSAPAGAAGRWELDPHNVTIATGGSATLAQVDAWTDSPGSDFTVDPATFNAATNVSIRANNDILINDAITKTAAGGDLTMNAGRSIVLEDATADITLNGGFFLATINDAQANATYRDAGTAVFNMNGATITTGGGGATAARIDISTESGHGATGDIMLGTLDTRGASGTNNVGANVIVDNLVGGITLSGTIVTSGSPLRSTAGAGLAGGNVTLSAAGAVALGSITTTGGPASGNSFVGGGGGNVTVTGATVSTAAIDTSGGNASGTAARAGGAGGNISLTADGATPTLTLSGDLTTIGGNASIATANGGAGGDVTLTGAIRLAASTTNINAQRGTFGAGGAGGVVTFGAGSTVTATTAGNALSIANTAANIVFNGTTYDFGTGGLTLNTTGTLRLDDTVTRFNVPTSGTLALPASVLLSGTGPLEILTGAGGTLNLSSTVNFSNGARTVTFTADDFTAGGNFTNAANLNLVIRPFSAGRHIIVGQAGATAGNLNVTSGALAFLLNSGLESLTIGRGDQASTMTIGSDAYAFPNEAVPTIRFLTNGNLTVSGALSVLGTTRDTNFVFDAGSGTFDNTAALITARRNGNLSITGAALNLGALASGSGGITLSTAGSATGSGAITTSDGLLLRGGGSYTLTNAGNAVSTLAADNAGSLTYTDADALSVGTVGGVSGISVGGSVVLRTLAGNLSLASAITGSAATLDPGANFINSAGANALTATAGRWLVYSQDPRNDTVGGLSYAFKQYNTAYPTAPTPTSGNGFLYTLAPTLTPSLTGTIEKTYDATTAATVAPANYAFSGAILADAVVANSNAPGAGTYSSEDVGTRDVTVTSLPNIASGSAGSMITVTDGTATVYGYTLGATTATGLGIGTINAAHLTITADGKITYVGDPLPLFTATYSGFVGGETSALVSGLNLTTTATTASPAGNYLITAGGATAPNYAISYVGGKLQVFEATSSEASQALLFAQNPTDGVAAPAPTASVLGAGFGAMPRAGGPGGLPGEPTGPATISGFGMGYAAEAANDFANAVLDGAGALPPPPRALKCAENGNGCVLNGR